MHLSHFKGCCWFRFIFITTKNIILILLCILLFEVTKPKVVVTMATRTMIFFNIYIFFLFLLKPWLTLSEHGNSERILDALVVVKLLPTLKHVINLKTPKKIHRIMNVAYLKVKHGLRFIYVHQLWSFAFSRKHEVRAVEGAGADAGMARQVFFFGSNWDGAPGSWCPMQTALYIYKHAMKHDVNMLWSSYLWTQASDTCTQKATSDSSPVEQWVLIHGQKHTKLWMCVSSVSCASGFKETSLILKWNLLQSVSLL